MALDLSDFLGEDVGGAPVATASSSGSKDISRLETENRRLHEEIEAIKVKGWRGKEWKQVQEEIRMVRSQLDDCIRCIESTGSAFNRQLRDLKAQYETSTHSMLEDVADFEETKQKMKAVQAQLRPLQAADRRRKDRLKKKLRTENTPGARLKYALEVCVAAELQRARAGIVCEKLASQQESSGYLGPSVPPSQSGIRENLGITFGTALTLPTLGIRENLGIPTVSSLSNSLGTTLGLSEALRHETLGISKTLGIDHTLEALRLKTKEGKAEKLTVLDVEYMCLKWGSPPGPLGYTAHYLTLAHVTRIEYGRGSRAWALFQNSPMWRCISLYTVDRSFDFIMPDDESVRCFMLAISRMCPRAAGRVASRAQFYGKSGWLKVQDACMRQNLTVCKATLAAIKEASFGKGLTTEEVRKEACVRFAGCGEDSGEDTFPTSSPLMDNPFTFVGGTSQRELNPFTFVSSSSDGPRRNSMRKRSSLSKKTSRK